MSVVEQVSNLLYRGLPTCSQSREWRERRCLLPPLGERAGVRADFLLTRLKVSGTKRCAPAQ